MTDRDAFVAAIAAKPEDDLPRLVFADWLDEHGEPARAGFIRDQIALAKLRPGTDEYQALFRRTADTLRANLPGWVQAACDAFGQPAEWKPEKAVGGRFPIWFRANELSLVGLEFTRGFIDQAFLSLNPPLKLGATAELFRQNPITRMIVAGVRSAGRWAEAVTDGFRSARELSVFNAAPLEVADAVFGSPQLGGVERLRLHTPLLAQSLVRSPMARRITRLGVMIDTNSLAALTEFPLDDRLHTFKPFPMGFFRDGRAANVTTELWSALSRVAFRPTLKRLDLTRCGMTDDGLAAFARGEEWIRLQGLKLGGNRFGDRGWADFARGWRTPELTYLDASRNRLTDAAAVALARSGMIQTLRTIDLRGCRIGGRGAVALANAVRSSPLVRLLLAGNPLRPKDTAAVRKVLGERTDLANGAT